MTFPLNLLHVFGFAYIQVDPVTRMKELLPLRCARALPARGYGQWQRLLKELPPYQAHRPDPVVSPSLSLLRQLRQKDTGRPLILCQMALAPCPPPHALSAITYPIPLTGFTLGAGLLRPLVFCRDWPEPDATHPGFDGSHPLEKRITMVSQANPDACLRIQEDGALLVQPHLLRPFHSVPESASHRRWRDAHEHRFGEAFGFQSGVRLVCAASANALAWFRRDAVRLLNRRSCFWTYPDFPDPRDPLRHFVLALDRDILFAHHQTSCPVVHLDGHERRRHFRMLRFKGSGQPRWRVDGDSAVHAEVRLRGRKLQLKRIRAGWELDGANTLAPGTQVRDAPSRDDNLDYQRRAHRLEALGL